MNAHSQTYLTKRDARDQQIGTVLRSTDDGHGANANRTVAILAARAGANSRPERRLAAARQALGIVAPVDVTSKTVQSAAARLGIVVRIGRGRPAKVTPVVAPVAEAA